MLAIWSHFVTVPLIIVAIATYIRIRTAWSRQHLFSGFAVVGGVAAAVTCALSVASGFELGRRRTSSS